MILDPNFPQAVATLAKMARGNQRDKAREKNQKAQAGMVRKFDGHPDLLARTQLIIGQKNKNTASGSEQQRNKDAAAEIMRKKQEAGIVDLSLTSLHINANSNPSS